MLFGDEKMINKNNSPYCVSYLCRQLTVGIFILFLVACSSRPAQQPSQQINLSLQTAADINPDDQGRANPVHIRVWGLSQVDNFARSDYFSLIDSEDSGATESKKLLDIIMMPNEQRQIALTLPAEITAIGVVSAWRNIQVSNWKALTAIPSAPHKPWYRRMWPETAPWQPHLCIQMRHLTTTIKTVD